MINIKHDAKHHESLDKTYDTLVNIETNSCICIPIFSSTQTVIAVFYMVNKVDGNGRLIREEDHCGRSMYVWREMLKHGIQADTHFYDVLARTCIKKRHPESAYEAVFEQQLSLIAIFIM